MAETTPVPLNRTERTLAFMIAGVGGVSLLCIIAVFVVAVAGGTPWPIVAVLPSVGLPIAFILIIVFAVVSVVRRRRIANGASTQPK